MRRFLTWFVQLPFVIGWRAERRRNRKLTRALRKAKVDAAREQAIRDGEIERLRLEVEGLALLHAHLKTWTEASTATADRIATVMGRVLPEEGPERLERKRKVL